MRRTIGRLFLSLAIMGSTALAFAPLQAAASMTAPRPAVTYASNSLGSNIATLAWNNLDKHACDRNSLGGTGYTVNGYSSCNVPNWCWIFSGWVWSKSGVSTTGLNSVGAYEHYKHAKTGTPHVGDVVIFYQKLPDGSIIPDSHIGIVYSVSGGTVTAVAGNEDNVWVWLRSFPAAVGSYSGNTPTGYVSGYVTP